jgi:hypothetical protein
MNSLMIIKVQITTSKYNAYYVLKGLFLNIIISPAKW